MIEDNEAEVGIELSQGKIRLHHRQCGVDLKLIDGTFRIWPRHPAEQRQGTGGRRRRISRPRRPRLDDSSERRPRGEAGVVRRQTGAVGDQSDSGSATEELEVEYASMPLDIGFIRAIAGHCRQIEGEVATLRPADPGSPTLVQDKDSKARLRVMPMRV